MHPIQRLIAGQFGESSLYQVEQEKCSKKNAEIHLPRLHANKDIEQPYAE
jgi:hypothetical protein